MFAIYGEAKIPITESTTVAQAKNMLATLYPEVANYQNYTDDNGDVRFRPTGGSKGAVYAIYGEAKIPITEATTVAQAKNMLASLYPEVANYQDYTDEDGNVRFRPTGGSKGL